MTISAVSVSATTASAATVSYTESATTGTVYVGARTDRQWYSVANGDSQAQADADKLALIDAVENGVSGSIVSVSSAKSGAVSSQTLSGLSDSTAHYFGVVATSEPIAKTFYQPFMGDISDWAFTRTGPQSGQLADNATYTITDDDTPVFTRNGVLLEGARTNVAIYTEAQDNVIYNYGSGGDGGVTADSSVAPNGNKVGDQLYAATADLTYRGLDPTATITAGETWTVSLYAKAASTATCKLYMARGSPEEAYEESTGALFSATTEFVRYFNSYTYVGTHSAGRMAISRNGATQLENIDTTFWQYEKGGFPSSYIPNATATAVARGATAMSRTLASMDAMPDSISNDFGVQIKPTMQFDDADTTGDLPLFALGTGNDKIELEINQGTVTLTKTISGAPVTATAAATYTVGTQLDIKAAVTSAGMKLWVDAATGTNANTAAIGAAQNTVYMQPGFVAQESIKLGHNVTIADVEAW